TVRTNMDIGNSKTLAVVIIVVGVLVILSPTLHKVKVLDVTVNLRPSTPLRSGILICIGLLISVGGFVYLWNASDKDSDNVASPPSPTVTAPPIPPLPLKSEILPGLKIGPELPCPDKKRDPVRLGVPPPIEPKSGLDL